MKVNLNRFIFLVLLAAVLALATPTIAANKLGGGGDATTEVRSLVEKAVFPMKVTRLNIAGDYAVATVADGIIGGSVLAQKTSPRDWQIVQQAGGAYGVSDLLKFGVNSKVANQLKVAN